MNSVHRQIGVGLIIMTTVAAAVAQPPQGEWGRPGARQHHETRAGMRGNGPPERSPDKHAHIESMIARIAGNPEVRKDLGITDEQVSRLRNGFYELRNRQVDLRAALEKGGLEQAHLMTQPDVDEGALMKVIENTGRTRTEMAKLRVRQLLLVKKTLTQEQITGLRTHLREHFQKGRSRPDHDRGESRERWQPRRGGERGHPGPEEE